MTKSLRLRPLLLTLGILGFLSHTAPAQVPAAPDEEPTIDRQEPVKAAVIVRNRAGTELDAQQRILEDLIAGEITGLGVSVISRGDVIESIGAYEGGRSAAAAGADNLFANNTSALRLAQNLGADYLLTASILSVGSRDRSFSGYGVKTNNIQTTLRLNYRIVNGRDGGSAVSENIEVTRKESMKDGGVTTALLQEAAEKMAKGLEKQLVRLPEVQEAPGLVSVTIQATMQDLSLPDVVRGTDGEYTVTANSYQLEVTGAEIEVNGLALGTTSTGTTIHVPAGINKLRVSRPGYEDAIRNVNFFEGQRLLIPMQLSGAGLARMREMTGLLQDLKADAKLTDAQVSEIEGHAQFLRQSGVRIDYQTNTTEPIQLHQTTNSLFGGTPPAAR